MRLFDCLLHKTAGERSEWEYPFAVAGINLTFALEELLDLRDARTARLVTERTPSSPAARGFLGLLSNSAVALEEACPCFGSPYSVGWLQTSLS